MRPSSSVWARRRGQFVELTIGDGLDEFVITPGQARRMARELWATALDIERSNAPTPWWRRWFGGRSNSKGAG